jgi:dihydroxyacid dehydratase/phosphogluconate dehydratase
MKYSLVSREVIADAIETSVNGQAMDGVLGKAAEATGDKEHLL